MGPSQQPPSTVEPIPFGLTHPPVQVVTPVRQTLPFVYNSPHSGQLYPEQFLAASRLNQRTIRRSEDLLVDALIAPVVELGVPLVKAVYPRAFVDVNREPYELDPKMFRDQLPPFANSRSLRVAGGLGTVPRIVADAKEIYTGKLDVEEALARVEHIYRPYHDALRRELARTHVRFGCAVLIDCHSMPSNHDGNAGRRRPDFVIGDRYGTSCADQLVERTLCVLRDLGYSVNRNKPYAGGFITEHYGRPSRGLHAIQVEVNRALYMDEARLELHSGFYELQAGIVELAQAIAVMPISDLQPDREAAE